MKMQLSSLQARQLVERDEHPDTCTVTQRWIKMTTSRFFSHFISVAVQCTTVVYYMVKTAFFFFFFKSLLVDDKAQESGSRKVSSNSPGNQGKGIHKLVLQSVTHKSCLRVKLQFFSTHLTIIKLFLCHLQLFKGTITSQVLQSCQNHILLYMWDYCV